LVIAENVEAVARVCAAWGASDLSAIREIYAPDVVAEAGDLWPEGRGAIHGADAIMRTFESILATFVHNELIPQSLLDAEDVLLVPSLWRGVLKGSEAAVEQHLVLAYRFRERRAVFVAWYADIEEALERIGLPRPAADSLTPFNEALAACKGPAEG
jgi:ketosteroid isomerase-like protein